MGFSHIIKKKIEMLFLTLKDGITLTYNKQQAKMSYNIYIDIEECLSFAESIISSHEGIIRKIKSKQFKNKNAEVRRNIIIRFSTSVINLYKVKKLIIENWSRFIKSPRLNDELNRRIFTQLLSKYELYADESMKEYMKIGEVKVNFLESCQNRHDIRIICKIGANSDKMPFVDNSKTTL
jgi:hypothetical protein